MVRRDGTGLPVDVADRGAGEVGEVSAGRLASMLTRVDRAATAARPQLFAYQFLYQVVPDATGFATAGRLAGGAASPPR